jgi:4-hydroxymandelate oxidase
MRDSGLTEALLERVVAAGDRALGLTVDITGLQHPRSPSPMSIEPGEWGDVPTAARTSPSPSERVRARGRTDRAGLGFDAIAYLRERTSLPVVLKGVLRADDARRAVDAGAAAVVVRVGGGHGPSTG